jgi:hypothetical protein
MSEQVSEFAGLVFMGGAVVVPTLTAMAGMALGVAARRVFNLNPVGRRYHGLIRGAAVVALLVLSYGAAAMISGPFIAPCPPDMGSCRVVPGISSAPSWTLAGLFAAAATIPVAVCCGFVPSIHAPSQRAPQVSEPGGIDAPAPPSGEGVVISGPAHD